MKCSAFESAASNVAKWTKKCFLKKYYTASFITPEQTLLYFLMHSRKSSKLHQKKKEKKAVVQEVPRL